MGQGGGFFFSSGEIAQVKSDDFNFPSVLCWNLVFHIFMTGMNEDALFYFCVIYQATPRFFERFGLQVKCEYEACGARLLS